MSNSNTYRRKAKKRAHGKALAHAFAGLTYSGVRDPGKSTLQAHWNLLQAGHTDYDAKNNLKPFILYDQERMSHPRCNQCGCDLFFNGCFCNSPEVSKDFRKE